MLAMASVLPGAARGAAEEDDYGMTDARLHKYSLSLLVGTTDGDFTAGVDGLTRFWEITGLPGYYMALRYRANLAVKRTIYKLENTYKSFPYHLHRVGVTLTGQVAKTYRIYADVDFLAAFPNRYFSEYYALGVYAGAGLELYANLSSSSAYYLETGYYVSDGYAENARDPVKYLNGIGGVIGWRYFFK